MKMLQWFLKLRRCLTSEKDKLSSSLLCPTFVSQRINNRHFKVFKVITISSNAMRGSVNLTTRV